MMAAETRTLLVTLTLLLATAVGGGTASGHNYDAYYRYGTYPGRPHQERVFFDRSAAGAIRDRFVAAQNEWDRITSRFQFLMYRDEIDEGIPRNCSADQPRRYGEQASLIAYHYIDGRGDTLAGTLTCSRASDNRLEYFLISVDTADDIYFGRSDAPEGSADMGSLATHELGHAAGFSWHYNDPEMTDAAQDHMCREHDDRPTMCAGLEAGTEYQRNLQEHDTHTHADAYNR